MTQRLSSITAHNAAGASLSERNTSQRKLLEEVVRQDCSHMLDRGRVSFEPERVATSARLRPLLHCKPISNSQYRLFRAHSHKP